MYFQDTLDLGDLSTGNVSPSIVGMAVMILKRLNISTNFKERNGKVWWQQHFQQEAVSCKFSCRKTELRTSHLTKEALLCARTSLVRFLVILNDISNGIFQNLIFENFTFVESSSGNWQ